MSDLQVGSGWVQGLSVCGPGGLDCRSTRECPA